MRIRALVVVCLFSSACSGTPAMPTGDAGDGTVDAAIGVDMGGDDAGDVDVTGDTGVGVLPVTEDGPFQVGHRSFDDTYALPDGGQRTIRIHIWYPTHGIDGEHPRYLGAFRDDGSIEDAPLAADSGPTYPVHIHTHGRRGFAGASIDVLRRHVTHGWVLVGPDHTDDTFTDAQIPLSGPVHYERILDVTETLDALEGLPADDPLAGKLRLDRVVEYMTHKPSARIRIAGHTDNVGNARANQRLSKKRAEAVRDYLVSQGIDGGRIEAVGYGDERPIAPNDTEEGRQKNRRIEAIEL